MKHDAGRHAGAAVGDELTLRKLGLRFGPGSVERTRNPAGRVVDRVRLTTPAQRGPRVDEPQRRISEATGELLCRDRVAGALARRKLGELDPLLASAKRAAPDVEAADQHGAVVVAEVPEQPPEPLGPAKRPVGDDEHARADSRTRRHRGECLQRRQRMAPRIRHREVRKVLVDIEERGARNMPGEVELSPPAGRAELPAAVDELCPHCLRA